MRLIFSSLFVKIPIAEYRLQRTTSVTDPQLTGERWTRPSPLEPCRLHGLDRMQQRKPHLQRENSLATSESHLSSHAHVSVCETLFEGTGSFVLVLRHLRST